MVGCRFTGGGQLKICYKKQRLFFPAQNKHVLDPAGSSGNDAGTDVWRMSANVKRAG
jgi:hypothetical protein